MTPTDVNPVSRAILTSAWDFPWTWYAFVVGLYGLLAAAGLVLAWVSLLMSWEPGIVTAFVAELVMALLVVLRAAWSWVRPRHYYTEEDQ